MRHFSSSRKSTDMDQESLNTYDDTIDMAAHTKMLARRKRAKPVIEMPLMTKIHLRELDLDMIRPNLESIKTKIGGSKLTVIGKPGSGKSVLIKALLSSKKHIIPVGTVISGSEDTNHFYSNMFPPAFVYEKFKMSIIENVHKRQKLASDYLSNPWAVLIMDDCMDDVRIFNDPVMIGLMKNSRHWSLLTIISTQYCLDFKPVIRSNMDGVFIFRDPNVNNREKLYKNFCSIIPSYSLFCQIMDELTEDYTCLYIHNLSSSNNWFDCVFYMKAPLIPDFQFGCKQYWEFSADRCK